MWRPVLEEFVEDESRWYLPLREFNSAPMYTPPGILKTLARYRSRYGAMYSETNGKLQSMNNCRNYQFWLSVSKPWIEGLHGWYNATHVSPNPGKWLATPLPLPEVWEYQYTVGGSLTSPKATFGGWNAPTQGLPTLASSVPMSSGEYTMFPTMSGSDWNLLVQASLAAMLPGIKNSLSLPNALFELKDFKTVTKTFGRINTSLDALKRLGGIWNEVFKARTAAKSLKTILKGVADSYLQASFNLLPLLNDIAALRGSLVNLRRELEALRQRAFVPQRRHFRRSLASIYPDEPNNVLAGTFPSFWVNTSPSASRSTRYNERMFTATIEYWYKLPALSDCDFAVRALLDRLGVNLNPQIIWNALPWSFVIDWIFGVSRWLGQFQTKLLEPVVHINGFCCSVKVQRVVTTSMSIGTYAGPVSSFTEEAYERKVGLQWDEVTSSISSSGLSLKEFSLSAALLLSRGR